MNINIGIVGNGFVGNAIYENLKDKFNVAVFDVVKEKCLNTFSDTINRDLVFVCLPTPMRSAEGAECNLSIINDFFHRVDKEIKNRNSIFVIKSTVPVGTTKNLNENYKNLKIIHNPEFLTANNAANDFKNSDRNIVGANNESDGALLLHLFNNLFPNAKNMIVSSNESEMIKYFANTFLAMKVSYFNLIFDTCEKFETSFSNVINGVCSDKRIGYSHSLVPGPDGDRGFGGTCFPKDINALIDTLNKNDLNSNILKEVWEYNKSIRKNWDWATNKSATLE